MTTATHQHVTETVTIDGCRLEYRWLGAPPRQAPTIVFLHEGLGSIAQWRDFPSELCTRTGFSGLVYNRAVYPLIAQFLASNGQTASPRRR